MHRVLSSVLRGAALGASLSLAAGPGLALDIGTTIGVGPRVVPPPTINPTPVIGAFRPIEHAPELLDFGTLRSDRGDQRTLKLTLTSPNEGNLTAKMSPAGPFQVTRLIGTRRFLDPITGRWRNQTVPGNGTLSVIAGQKVEVEVALKPTADTEAMPRANLELYGRNWYLEVPARGLVAHEPEIVAEVVSGDVKVVPGGEATATIRLTRTRFQSFIGPSGMDRDVTITAQGLPAGLTMEPVTIPVPAGVDHVDATVRFQASEGTPVGWNQGATLLVDSSENRQPLDLTAQVYPTSRSWSLATRIGDVSYQGTLTIHSDGTWQWKAHLHDSGTLLGDNYFLSLWFNVPISAAESEWLPPAAARERGWRPNTLARGELGAVFGGSRDGEIDQSNENDPYSGPGPNRWLREHYLEAFDAGVGFTGTASPDLGPLVEWFVESAWKAVGMPIDL